jgi:hypothetical protein
VSGIARAVSGIARESMCAEGLNPYFEA